MKYYMVTFDRESDVSYGSFHEEFTGSPMINGWFHYILSSYIIGSNNSATDLSRHFTMCAKNNNISTTHLVVEINLPNRQGMLVDDAWQWIRDNSKG